MKKRVLIFESWNESPQYETGLELAEVHASQGDDITYVNIGAELPFLEWHLNNNSYYPRRIILKLLMKRKFRLTKKVLNKCISFNNELLISSYEKEQLYEDYSFNNIDELKKYVWEDMDIGIAAASSLISVTDDLNPDIKYKYSSVLNRILHTSKIVYCSFKKWHEKINPDIIYFRNGRVASYRPIFRFCQQNNLNFIVHDRGCNKTKYSLNTTIRHDFDMVQDQIVFDWNNEKNDSRKEIVAHDFYKARRAGKEQGWMSFRELQKENTLPKNWDKKKYNIVFFNSSMGEFAAIDNVTKGLFTDQIEAVYKIGEIVNQMDETDFYVRLHPNLLNQAEVEQNLWASIKHPNVNLIKADEDIDTYALIENANLVIVCMSTVGIEAAYYGKPSIMFDRSWYDQLGSVYFPKSIDEFELLIKNKKLEPLGKEGTLKYGFYMNTFGIEYIFFEPQSLRSGIFKGINLQKKSLGVQVLLYLDKILYSIIVQIRKKRLKY